MPTPLQPTNLGLRRFGFLSFSGPTPVGMPLSDQWQQELALTDPLANPRQRPTGSLQPPKPEELKKILYVQLVDRWEAMRLSRAPLRERYTLFWANHFTVSAKKFVVARFVADFEFQAIRPHIGGTFGELAFQAVTHVAMLGYLDNLQSFGPSSRLGKRVGGGLNENLAREVLELHTLGVGGGYQQADVEALAKILTGWTVKSRRDAEVQFESRVHEPGPKRVLGKTYPEGPDALRMVLNDLAMHPATANHLSTKLVEFYLGEALDPISRKTLIAEVARNYLSSGGSTAELLVSMLKHPTAQMAFPAERRRLLLPEEWAINAHRFLEVPFPPAIREFRAMVELGQPYAQSDSPAGWSVSSSAWLSGDALLKRLLYADFLAASPEAPKSLTAVEQRLDEAFGGDISSATRTEIQRSSSVAQAIRLVLLSPEFLKVS